MSSLTQEKTRTAILASIGRFHRYDEDLASGAQPSPEEIEALRDEGFDVIFNISPSSTRNALPTEAGIVEGLGMDYVHFPVDCSNLRPIHYQTFRGIMSGLEGKRVFVHCGGNIKSSNLIHMYNVLEKGMPEAESLATLKTIQEVEDKWFVYYERMGMQGLA